VKIAKREIVAVTMSLLLLGGAAADRISLLAPKDSGPYHRRVKAVAAGAGAPLNFGDWVGHDVPVPPEAAEQLHPNVIISRCFNNILTGDAAALLLVQCPDVRDLTPHYPPICYPGRGLTLTTTLSRDWQVGGLSVAGTEYQFESNAFQTDKLTIVENFMVLPDGRTCRDMTQVRKLAGLRTRYFGAAQVQVVFTSETPAERRGPISAEIIAAYKPLLDVILSGVHQ